MAKKDFDISIVRPRMVVEDFKFRAQGMAKKSLKKIKKGLHTFHTLETMAVNIYKYQISKKGTGHDLKLIVAMGTEMTHLQDFQLKLYEYGFRPSVLRCLYWVVGFGLGWFSRFMGERAVLKTGIWTEEKAVRHYRDLLKEVEWDDETRRIIEKNQADEFGHILLWQTLLKKLEE
jgi:demethoxyubiquinone hydroxylase (CLK1/Coq7/Cat5 family)